MLEEEQSKVRSEYERRFRDLERERCTIQDDKAKVCFPWLLQADVLCEAHSVFSESMTWCAVGWLHWAWVPAPVCLTWYHNAVL
jgi:hypothetical protein